MAVSAWAAPSWASVHQVPGGTIVRCACRRRVRAELLFDLRALPETRQDWGCDACRSRLIDLERTVDQETYLRRVGAPSEVLAHVARKREQRADALAAQAAAIGERQATEDRRREEAARRG